MTWPRRASSPPAKAAGADAAGFIANHLHPIPGHGISDAGRRPARSACLDIAAAAPRGLEFWIEVVLHRIAALVETERVGDATVIPAARTVAVHRVLATMIASAALMLAVLPLAGRPGPEIPAIIPGFVVGIVIPEAITGVLLFVQFRAARAWSLLVLGAAYVLSSLMAVFHLLTFPGAVLPGRGMIGSGQSTAWIFIAWVLGFAGLALAAIIIEASGIMAGGEMRRCPADRTGRAVLATVAAVVLAVGGVVLVVTVLPDRLPDLLGHGLGWTRLNMVANWLAIGLLTVGIALILGVIRDRNPLFLWLALALYAMGCALLLGQAGGGRYSVGWIVARASWVGSAAVLFLFFMAQYAGQQRQLAQARDLLEARVADRTADLRQALGQRDRLLREVYHRVRNNLQVVDSLVRMEAKRQPDPAIAARLGGLRNQLHALGLVHGQLMQSADLVSFDVAPFLHELAADLERSLSPPDGGLRIEVTAEAVPLTMEVAAPLGLIVTELVTNAAHHAYPAGTAGSLAIGLRRVSAEVLELVVADHGADPAAVDRYAARPGLGSRIVEGLVGQIDGTLSVAYRGGTQVTIRLPLPAPVLASIL